MTRAGRRAPPGRGTTRPVPPDQRRAGVASRPLTRTADGAGATDPAGGTGWPGSPSVVAVRRSGGFAGLVTTGQVVLGDDPRTSEIEGLLIGIGPAVFSPSEPQPDRYVYTFELGGQQVVVAEQQLTPELDRLARLLLDPDHGFDPQG